MAGRGCTRTGCTRLAVATLTFVYLDSTAVLGPLSTSVDPHGYDLCPFHANRLTVPRGWEVVRVGPIPLRPPPDDDWSAVADAVRPSAQSAPPPVRLGPEPAPPEATGRRKKHLTLVNPETA